MLAIIGGSGKIGGATLSALLSNSLIKPSEIVCTTSASSSSDSRWEKLASTGVSVRHADFSSPDSLVSALTGCSALFLVSTPQISLDFGSAPEGQGREKHHIAAIDAAIKAGVKHIYYTSLAFANPSKAGVMAAHIRTEKYLASRKGVDYTVLREGLYNESWPLYLGHYDVKNDQRAEVKVAGDSAISWTSIADLGLANALVISDPKEKWAGKTVYLSNTKDPKTLEEIAGMVSAARGREIKLKIVSRRAHEEYYINEKGMDKGLIGWWASTYDALTDGECTINDKTFEELLARKGRQAKPVRQTISEIING